MQMTAFFLTFVLSANIYASDIVTPGTKNLNIGFFTDSDLPKVQCGCWYYYPTDQKLKGKVIAIGESAKDALHVIINRRKVVIGNWQVEYQETYHLILYTSNQYKVNIHSTVLAESKYSSDYESVITIQSGSDESSLNVFGSCGC